jgi:Pyruvate/2-oxoacid:ferredoxin oxidoreductase delta subunit
MSKKKVFKPKGKGLGIENWLIKKSAITSENWEKRSKFFRSLMTGAMKGSGHPVYGGVVTKLNQSKVNQQISVPLHVDLSEHKRQVALPTDLLKKAIGEAVYRAGMKKCICRDSIGGCKNYPDAPSCVFLGKGARQLVTNGIAVELTSDEACARVDKAAEQGLLGHAFFLEAEQYFWGVKNEDMESFFEICFCCPCCCVNLSNLKYASEGQKRQNMSMGWTAVVEQDNCQHCHTCLDFCPVGAISDVEGITTISDLCYGCAACVSKCPSSALNQTDGRADH